MSDRPYPPDWLDDNGAAYLLTLPVSTFREYVGLGVLPAGVKIGKHRRWSRTMLNEALAAVKEARFNDGGDDISAALKGLAHGQKAKAQRHAA